MVKKQFCLVYEELLGRGWTLGVLCFQVLGLGYFFLLYLFVLCLPRKRPKAFTLSLNKVILSEALILL